MVRRCKFTCETVTKRKGWNGYPICYDYEFRTVTGDSEENKAFWAATPGGSLKVTGTQGDWFEVGKDYYLDIIPVNGNE